jgi:hypothetical protein
MGARPSDRDRVKRFAASAGEHASGGSGTADVGASARVSPGQPNAPSPERIGKIAHDFNNILTLVLGYGENLLKILPEGHRGRSYAEEICRAARDGERLSVELASCAHSAKPEDAAPSRPPKASTAFS